MRLNKKISLLLLLFGFIFSTYSYSYTIKISTVGFPPYGINEQGEFSGLYYDMANLITANAGYSSNNIVTPYARIVEGIKSGNIDLTIMFRYPALEEYVDYVAPFPSQQLVLLGLQGQYFKKISDLSGKKITYLRGTKLNNEIDYDKTIEKYEVTDYIHAIKMLMAGRVDAIIGSFEPIKNSALELEKIDNITILFDEPIVLDIKTPWLQISKKSRSHIDIDKLKESFTQLQINNTLNTLKFKYGLPTLD